MGTKFQGRKKEVESLNAFIKLNRASDTVLSATSKTYKAVALTESQFAVLELLYHSGSCSQQEIGKKILKSKGNITMVVSNLEKNGFLTKCKLDTDKRFYRIDISRKGKHLIDSIFLEHVRGITQVMSVLSSSELKQLSFLCKKLGLANDPFREEGA